MRIEIALDATAVAPGDTVRGRVRIVDGGRGRAVEVRLVFAETTPGDRHAAVVRSAGVIGQAPFETGQEFAFAIPLPADAPPPVRLARCTLGWEIDATVDRLGPDLRVRVPLAFA